MSFRTAGNRPISTSTHASSDQSRAGVTKRSSEATSSGTNSPRRSTIFRISASVNPALVQLDGSNSTSHSTAQAQQGFQRAGPSALSQTGMNIEDVVTHKPLQNATSGPFLQTRRRQPSTNNARAPLGPRAVEQGPQSSRFSLRPPPPAYNNNVHADVPAYEPSQSFEPVMNDINDFSFAMIDPTSTIPGHAEEMVDTPFSFSSEPTFNFDDFHDTITTNDTSMNHFALSNGFEDLLIPAVPQIDHRKVPTQTTIPAPSRKFSGAGTSLARNASNASTTSRAYVSKFDPTSTTTPAANPSSVIRGRRQSHFPPNAFNNSNPPPKAPRKSVGPGTFLPPETSEVEVKRRPSMGGRKSSAGSSASMRAGKYSSSREGSKSPRTLKTKSVLVNSTSSSSLLTPSRTPDPQKALSMSGQSTPGKRVGTPGRTTTPGANKRMSMATGLGARTISPTDARRMKRMSVMPTAPPVPNRRISQAPPTPQPDPIIIRPTSTAQSPIAHHRKSVITPSSSRTTPDPNRKSYSSGQSLSSATSYGSNKAPVVPSNRASQNSSSSRLPTPKPRTDAEEEVPPVPAIPKSFDSPASENDQPFFSARSSGLRGAVDDFDTSAMDIAKAMSMLDIPRPESEATSSLLRASEQQTFLGQWSEENVPGPVPMQHIRAASKSTTTNNDLKWSEEGLPNTTPMQLIREPSKSANTTNDRNKKMHPNLRLPPLNLLPLSTPTSNKISSWGDGVTVEIPSTPPGTRNLKTPSTPMTASKATFSTRNGRSNEDQAQAIRSSTSHYALRHDNHLLDDSDGLRLPTFNFETDSTSQRSMSPFLSSSLPKTSGDFSSFMRPNFSTELKRSGTQQKPNGPRAPSYSISTKHDVSTPSTDQSSSSTPLTAVNASSQNIQRKSSETKLSEISGNDSDAARFDNMPPPKLPASATWSNLNQKTSASPTQKPGFFRSRRKTSASSTNTLDQQQSIDGSMTQLSAAQPSMESVRSAIMTHPNRSASLLSQSPNLASQSTLRQHSPDDTVPDKDDIAAEEEMRKLASKRRDLEAAGKKLDSLRARAKPVKRASPSTALQTLNLNIFERGEIVDFPDIFFVGTKNAKKVVGDLSSTSTNFGYDDERGDYNIVEGDHLVYRYEVIDLLGKGSFGQVVRCIDHKTGELVAIKIIRNKKRFHQQALVEVDILKKLKEWDPDKKHNVVNFDQSFYFRGHLCISTDLLDMNLYEFIKVHDFRGFSLKLIRRFTKQMLSSLRLLHQKRVIHCDLKPENILLAHPAHADIKVIDFGSSCFENEKVYTYIQSRFYRSPEVILGMTYGMPIDMWSLGCILAELYTGYPIFPGENEQEQLACIMEVFGPPEKHLIEKSSRKKLFFDSMGKPRLTVSSKGKRRRPSSKDLRSVLKCEDDAFLDFIAQCLRWDPARRLNPMDAMRHEFITGQKMPASSRRAAPMSSTYSPMKRGTTVVVNGSARPLPQPPTAGGLRPLTLGVSTTSPSKATPRRQSSAVNGSAATAKRASHAAMNSGSSGGNRVTVKAVNPRTDLAAAAAAASLVK